uniref:glucuronosyltransferase n=1 Tax=Panagrellus redivivus TaxID=6233 RepID=A0A7E4VPX1_PANRE
MYLKFVFLWQLFSITNAINVLFFLLGTNQFERNTFEFLAQQLALRHHSVVTVKPVLIPEEPRLVKPKLHLVKEKQLKNLLPSTLYKPLEEVGGDVPWRQTYEVDAFDEPYWTGHNHSCYKMLNSNLMDTLKKDKLDVAVVYAGNPCQLAIVHILGIPFVYYDVHGFTDETIIASGNPWNLDSYSSRRSPSNLRPNFASRLLNGYHLVKEAIAQNTIPAIARVISKRYRGLDEPITKLFAEDYEIKKKFKGFPDVNKLKQLAEAYFVNTDPLLEDGTAFGANVIPVAGLHIDHVKPLFAPWNTTIAAAENGVIVVSLGTQADSSKMTANQAKAILGALSKLTKYRIYWRIGPNMQLPGIKLEDVPQHINLTTFVPQNDLIAHKRCKLLVTNGGMSSVMEAIAHGVPIVGVPLYGVNHANMVKVQNKGFGVIVNKAVLSESTLFAAMKEVLDNKRFETATKDASKEYRDRNESPFERALRAIEHIGRHRGAKFFKPSRQAYASTWTRAANLDFWLICAALAFFAGLFVQSLIGLLFGFVKNHGPAPGSAGVEIASTPRKESKKVK